MDATELELFGRSVGQAVERHTGEDLNAALAQLGWADALVEDPYTSVAVLFPRLGAANVTSAALDQVLATGLGRAAIETVAVVLPPLGTPCAAA